MLTLSIDIGKTVKIGDGGAHIKVVAGGKKRVRIGFEFPKSVAIVREGANRIEMNARTPQQITDAAAWREVDGDDEGECGPVDGKYLSPTAQVGMAMREIRQGKVEKTKRVRKPRKAS